MKKIGNRTVLLDTAHESLKPLTYTRSTLDIEVGGQTIFEHISDVLDREEYRLCVPGYLEEVTRKNSDLYSVEREVEGRALKGDIVYNSSVIPTEEISDKLEDLDKGKALFYGDLFIAARLPEDFKSFESLIHRTEDITDLEYMGVDEEPIHLRYPWNLVEYNGGLIENTFESGDIEGEIHESAEIIGNRENIRLGKNSRIDANTVIDVTEGPVFIDSDTRVWPNSRIEGPVYIGSNTKIGAGENAVIHENTHIGDVARVGGEVEESIIHSFTNKYHYGFFGHGVAGSWVNFGAGTTNSDLKNTYGNVGVEHPVYGELEAGLKTGATLGDHTKIDIGTLVYTGKQIGPVTKLSGTVEESVQPFTWKQGEEKKDYRVEEARKHVERMMERRKEHLPEGYIKAQKGVIDYVYSEEV